ncbi:MAG: NAD-dependent epimerase/dehydratase family protein [Bacteroidia bacterium]|nr:NAD-dependent epimerase/dehydratase family protein [Bacteroidia bacterium]
MILVTGGTGLVGSHLLFKLSQQKEKVIATYRKNSDLEAVKRVFSFYADDFEDLFDSINWIEADLTDVYSLTKAFEGVTQVYHSAAMISFKASDYKKMRKINIGGTANVVNLCIANNIKKLCFVSSIAAVGKSSSDIEITENGEWNIEDNNYGYAITKYGAEIEVWRGAQEGLDVIIVNPAVILGPGYWQNSTGKLFTNIYNGLNLYSEGITGFVGVTDVVNIMIQLMKSNIKNERYILVGKNDSFKNILFAIADGLGKKRPGFKITRPMSNLFWRFEWLLYKITKLIAFSLVRAIYTILQGSMNMKKCSKRFRKD